MKNIFYCSNAQGEMFPKNTRSKFDNYIDINHLSYLPSHDIEAAIKSITFDNKREEKLLKEHVIGVRSNISDFSIKNSEYDKIVALFVGSKLNDVVHIEFSNPTFFATQKEVLSRAHFELIDIETNSAPNFIIGSPTYIQVVIRKNTQRMKRPFAVFLDSSCTKSKEMYPKNNSMDFTIKLPERLEFRRNWNVVLKSLFLSNKFINGNDIYIRYYNRNWGKSSLYNVALSHIPFHDTTLDGVLEKINNLFHVYGIKVKVNFMNGRVSLEDFDTFREEQIIKKFHFTYSMYTKRGNAKWMKKVRKIKVTYDSYQTFDTFLNALRKQFENSALPLIIEKVNDKVKIKNDGGIEEGDGLDLKLDKNLSYILGFTSVKKSQTLIFDENNEYLSTHNSQYKYAHHSLSLSPSLAHMLGFKQYTEDKSEFTIQFNEVSQYTASYEPDIFLQHPRNLLIGCDVVCDTIFGGEHVKLLRLVPNPVDLSSDILTFQFLQNEYVELGVKEFDTIRIRIFGVDGKTIRCISEIPTRLQLMFVNI